MSLQTIKTEIYQNINGKCVLKEVVEQEVEVNLPSTEELLKEKEQELLKIYDEIQKLKSEN
jgi:hypothetical protein